MTRNTRIGLVLGNVAVLLTCLLLGVVLFRFSLVLMLVALTAALLIGNLAVIWGLYLSRRRASSERDRPD